ncbi:unnamed protein product [Camellia sinensis]
MIQGLCEEGLLDEAKELFVKIEQNGCLPNDVTYNIVIQGFLGQQKYHEASILLDEINGRMILISRHARTEKESKLSECRVRGEIDVSGLMLIKAFGQHPSTALSCKETSRFLH